MSLRGHIKNGVIILDEPAELPEGAEVRVQVVPQSNLASPTSESHTAPTFYEKLKPFIGCLDDMPPDMSVNLDHYLYGAPKQQE